MTRYYGAIGFAESVETAPGVIRDRITERYYKGDVIRNQVRWNPEDQVNEIMRVDNSISVIADPYFESHIQAMRYITWLGQRWKISSIQVERPRITLQIGSEYHDQQAT